MVITVGAAAGDIPAEHNYGPTAWTMAAMSSEDINSLDGAGEEAEERNLSIGKLQNVIFKEQTEL